MIAKLKSLLLPLEEAVTPMFNICLKLAFLLEICIEKAQIISRVIYWPTYQQQLQTEKPFRDLKVTEAKFSPLI